MSAFLLLLNRCTVAVLFALLRAAVMILEAVLDERRGEFAIYRK